MPGLREEGVRDVGCLAAQQEPGECTRWKGCSGKSLGVLDGSGMGARFPESRMCVLLEARCPDAADHEISIYRVMAK